MCFKTPAKMEQDWYNKSLRCYTFSNTPGAYRTCLGTKTCVVCRHYNFLRDDVKSPISFREYFDETGHRVTENDFFIKKTIIAKAQCPLCGALYLMHCYGHDKTVWLHPYNMSFFYSFAEHPLVSDVASIEERWLRYDEDAPHISYVEPPADDRMSMLQKQLDKLRAQMGLDI